MTFFFNVDILSSSHTNEMHMQVALVALLY